MREIVLILQNIRSLHNVGSIFRSADVFGAAKIYLTGYTGAPPRKEISKVALGAETWIPWEFCARTSAVIKRLRAQKFQIIALETAGRPLERHRLKNKIALVLGNEVRGVSKAILKQADQVLAIPMFGKKESLNVSVAAGVALYALRQSDKRA
jgi:tRNA G18 (ribose-2'-O)-methylase SpoU